MTPPAPCNMTASERLCYRLSDGYPDFIREALWLSVQDTPEEGDNEDYIVDTLTDLAQAADARDNYGAGWLFQPR